MKPSTSPRIAVTGATGYVGRFVVEELQRQGVEVRALCRPESDRDGFEAPIEWIEGDLRSPQALLRLVEGVQAVVHLAYEHIPGRYRGGEGDDLERWIEANVSGSLRLIAEAARANVPRFVFLSSRAVFSSTEPGRVLDESHPVSPDSHYGAYKAAVESFLHSFQSQQGMQAFAVRATGVYGVARPIERSKWWSLVGKALNGDDIGPPRGGTEVFGGDVARIVWALLSRSLPDVDIVHASDLYVTNAEIARKARRFAGLSECGYPESPSAPRNPLECRNLHRLGIKLGGVASLEATVERLVEATRQSKTVGELPSDHC